MFNFKDWWFEYHSTYKAAKCLFHNQLGAIDGPWLKKMQKDLSRPDLYPVFKGKATLEDNCNEAITRLRADIKVKRKQQNEGQHKTVWQLPMLSVYVGQGERGRRYTWDIESMVSDDKGKNSLLYVCRYCDNTTTQARTLCTACERSLLDDQHKQVVRPQLEKMGLYTPGESRKTVTNRCREFLKENGYILPDAVKRQLRR